MRSIYCIIIVLLPFFSLGQVKLRPYVQAGYFYDNVREPALRINHFYRTFDHAHASGIYAGLGMYAGLKVIPLGLQLEAAYENHWFNYYLAGISYPNGQGGVLDVIYQTPPQGYPSSAGYIKINPSISYNMIRMKKFSSSAELGIAYRIRITNKEIADNNYTNLSAAVGLGYDGILIKVGYEYGLTGLYKTVPKYTYNSIYWQIKSSRVNVGLTVYPFVLLKGKL